MALHSPRPRGGHSGSPGPSVYLVVPVPERTEHAAVSSSPEEVAQVEHMTSGSALGELSIVGAAFLAGMGVLERSRRTDRSPARPAPEAVRWSVVVLLFVTTVVHVAMVPDHLEEAPYMGDLFVGFSVAAFGVAAFLAARPARSELVAAAVLCAAAIVTYAATRLVPFPQLADDVGAWFEPLGVVAVLSEAAVVALVAVALRSRHRRPLTRA